MRRALPAAFALALAACGGAPSGDRGRASEGERGDVELYFPSALGAAWAYELRVRGAEPGLVVAKVVAREGARVAISVSGSEPNVYRLEPGGVRSIGTGDFVLEWPLEEGRRWPSRGAEAIIVDANATVETDAGTLERCVLVRERRPAGGDLVETHFCPGVGVARVAILPGEGGPASSVTRLRGFSATPLD